MYTYLCCLSAWMFDFFSAVVIMIFSSQTHLLSSFTDIFSKSLCSGSCPTFIQSQFLRLIHVSYTYFMYQFHNCIYQIVHDTSLPSLISQSQSGSLMIYVRVSQHDTLREYQSKLVAVIDVEVCNHSRPLSSVQFTALSTSNSRQRSLAATQQCTVSHSEYTGGIGVIYFLTRM